MILGIKKHAYYRQAFALLVVLAFWTQAFGQAAAPAFTPAEKRLADGISVASIKEGATALSSPEMQGRGTMQPGGEKAAKWIADRFQSIGLKPLGDKGSYFQRIEFKEAAATTETSFKIGDESLVHGEDFAFYFQDNGNKDVTGDMVFIAYGIQAKSINRDDLAGVDVKGKVVVMLEGPPANIREEDWKKQKASNIFTQALVMKGAAALVYIGHGREDNPPDVMLNYMSRRQISMPDEKGFPDFVPPFVYVGSKGAEKLFARSGVTLKDALAQAETNAFKPIKLNLKAKLIAKYKTTKGTSPNVVGLLEGSDPKLKEEAIVYTAHYDAYGMDNGKVYPGAADNALGTAEMLAVAESMAKLDVKPKRSMIFLAVTAEEYGLFGSKHWAKKPTWDIKRVAANLNLDGVGVEVYGPVKTIVGYGGEHSTLGAMLDTVARSLEIETIPDPIPDEKVFYRSDHYSFVERGIPALKLMGAPAGDKDIWIKRMKAWQKTGDYHQSGDVIKADWAWEGPETVARVMAIMGWRISENQAMPSWLATSRFAKLERGNTKEVERED